MHPQSLILIALTILACASFRLQHKARPAWNRNLTGWQKFFGIVAVVLALFIILNPEFLALGLLGDTTFFDVLVLALSLQMHTFVVRACQWSAAGLTSLARRVTIPSPGFRYLMFVSLPVIASAVSALQRTLHRFLS